MIRVGTAGLLAVLGFALTGAAGFAAARADTIYDFTPTMTSAGPGVTIQPFSLVLTLADDFTPEAISRNCSYPTCSSTGNFADFSLAASLGSQHLATLDATPDGLFESTHGQIDGSSGWLFWATSSDITLSLTWGNGVWNAMFNSDFIGSGCYASGYNCIASGTLTEVSSVPEPASLGVFGIGLLGLVVARRRRAQRH